ncbi:MAG: FAD-dependent oxidoreductase, partial [Snodgrassella alvi]|nr:FAD-dependent oxidoreductase [Snodgrassella alvi]
MTTLPPCSIVETDVLIVGAGLAGLTVALSLPEHFHITVVVRQDLSICASTLAQGGIAAVIDEADSVAEHVADTLIAGAGSCDETQTATILVEGANAIEWLCAHGVEFTRENGQLHLTREGGHGKRRIVHAADHTGHSITETLQQQLLARPNIQVLTHTFINEVILENTV